MTEVTVDNFVNKVHHSECLALMKQMPDNCVDSIVTDPPYGLSFMDKHWDYDVPSTEIWKEAFRVLKPGGHVLSFFGTRTYHRGVVAIEDAGFEIRDQIGWVYGSGFPKSHNIKEGQFSGWGTALKPAWEPIVVARKPLDGTVADNVVKYGTGALNIDGCRVSGPGAKMWETPRGGIWKTDSEKTAELVDNPQGRWPANLIHDGSEEVAALFPDGKGAFAPVKSGQKGFGGEIYGKYAASGDDGKTFYGDGLGSAARFFYCAKTTKKDRDAGVDAAPQGEGGPNTKHKNHHPTVKPTDLMRYLCRMVTQPGGIVLDPFLGSGSTAKAAVLEGFRYIGIEMSEEYCTIARARIAAAQEVANGKL